MMVIVACAELHQPYGRNWTGETSSALHRFVL